MERYVLRLRTLGEGHPTKAILGKEWVISQLNIVMPFIEGRRKASCTLLRVFAKIAKRSNEEFSHYSDTCQPGDRLINLDDNRVQKIFFSRDKQDQHRKHDDPPPKKKDGKISRQFRVWIRDTWTPHTFDLISDEKTLVMWTDGSALIDQNNLDNTQCASAWIITRELWKVAEGMFSAGCATSYDVEVLASAKAANKVWELVQGSTETLIFASDNIGNLQKIMKTGKGPSQLATLMANQEAARFLEGRKDCKVIFLWSPSHVGILWNEAVNKLALDLANDRDVPIADIVSFSFAQQGIRREMLSAWAREYKHPAHVRKANVRGVPDPSILSRLNQYLGNKMCDIVDFAYMHPLAATLEWAEILSKFWRQTQWLNLKEYIGKGGNHDKPFSKNHNEDIKFFDEINKKAEVFAQHLLSQWEHDKEVLTWFDAIPQHVVDAGDVHDEEVDEMLRVLDQHPLPRIDSLLDSVTGLMANASQLSDELAPSRSPIGQLSNALWFTLSPGG
ncbi:hypothetical protein EVJ58_g9479 [Rhodofomes roseus]|uniref:Uncharacterized protein n=1 Tax=Rhodofomes roseus TaxID=34475 RepID=A0A4Y9XVJ8_9APHY|nr:hypothetical protein EVJ58_g9479 [Rhodofomes roseus]